MLRRFVHQKLVLLTALLAGSVCSFSQNTSNKGREFWVGYGHHQFMETGTNLMNMRLYLSTEAQAATVTVTIDSSGSPFIAPPGIGSIWTRTYTIPPYTAIQSDIIPKGPVNGAAAPGDLPSDPFWDARLYDLPPESGGAGGSGIFRRKGIHIVSSVPITAYAHIYGSTSSGATMLIPITAWGYEYVSLNSNQSYASNCYNWTYVMAYRDNTVIQITPSVKTRGQNRTGLLPGVTTTVTLMKGQIYQLIGANNASDGNGNGGADQGGLSLSGTRIKSVAGPTGECYPIAVFAGSSRTSNAASCGLGGGDNDNQQLFPMHSWGKKYSLAPFSGSNGPGSPQNSIVKVAFSEPPPATVLRRNGVVVPVPAGALFYTYESSTADYLEATKPIMVNQFMTGGNTCANGNLGDPEMVVVAPMEQAIKEVTFYRQSREQIQVNYLTLVVPTAGLGSLRIDNSATFDLTYPHPQNALLTQPHTVVVKRWNIGPAQGFQCNVKCDSGFNAITYGLGGVESYAYSAGALINNLNALTGIHNQPDDGGATELHKFTAVGTPMDLSILIKYQPDRLTWKFSEMNPLPGACMNVNPALAGDYVMNPASAFADGTVVVNGITYYKYKLPQTFTFNCPGIYEIPVEAYSTGSANCGNREMFYPAVEVKQRLVVDYTWQNQTQCSKDTVYLFGPTSGLSGVEPFTTTQWRWVLPGGVRSTHQDTAVVLPPGTHELKLVAISPDGLLSDTVRKTVTIYPPPTVVFNAAPDVLCVGQTVNFTQIPSYGGPAPITNYYWNYGEGPAVNNMNNTGSHTYTAEGTYTAQAAVRVSDLCVGDTVDRIITVNPEAKIAFTFPTTCLPSTGVAQFGAAATDLGGTAITSYTWNFGDPASGANNTSNQQNPTHTFGTMGQYTVTLNITTSTGCTGDTTKVLDFDVAPILAYAPFNPVCQSAAPFSIATGTVTNGATGTPTYSGPGVTGTTFNPATAGPGTHTITYTFTTAACAETATQTITVFAPPIVSAGTYGPLCSSAAPVTLAGSPAGGTFSGPGVTGTTFNPATAGVGTHTITYSYTDGNGCSNTTTTSIQVYALPVVNAGTYAPVCVSAGAVTLAGTPAGGTFSGPGVTGTSFNPATAGAGSHTITYSYTDGGGCTNTNTATIVVNPLPVVDAGTYAAACINATAITLAGTPAGGTFTGPGVTGTTFNPATAGTGTHTITYNYTDANGCSASDNAAIVVNALPVVNAGTYAPVCANAAAVTLAGTPAGGTFSGTGVTGNTFNPAAGVAGANTITYTYTDANGCGNAASTVITVNALPTVDAGTYGPVCINGTAITMSGTPAGGTFSGPGVTGSSFSPVGAGIGSHTVVYNYTDANGCAASDNTTIVVTALPVADAGTYAPVCINAAAVTLAGTPAGGTFSGTGVTGNSFNPATAGLGTHTITYNYTDAGGCSASDVTTITVNALPVVNAGTYAPVCVSVAVVNLAGTPAGGTFSGPGVTGNSFTPGLANPGSNTITYTYTDGNGCANTATTTITVNPLPVVDAGTYTARCIDAAAVTLAGTPAGGTFTGPGVTGTTFNPATAGAGSHTITYSFTDANGCSASDVATIVVNPLPVVDAGTYPAACLNGGNITLAGTPAGGTFSGTGVTGTIFNPVTAGLGSHTITYNYTNANGCSSSDVVTITVNAAGTVDAGTYAPVCVAGASITLAGTPAGGTFSGPGVTGTTFNPATAGVGTHSITYNYTNANGCSGSGQVNIQVYALPTVNAGTYAAVCIDAAVVTLAGTPAGGTFSGPGVTGNTFNPATAGAGTHNIMYNYTDASGCSASDTKTITVNPLPTPDAGTYTAVCVNATAVPLVGTPAGGTWSGTGVTGSSFNPATAGAGTHTVTYNYRDANGCSASDIATIVVNALPVVNAGTYGPRCSDAAPLTLAGIPAGGTFSGPGVTGSSFSPATAGPGTHTITYSFTNANGCTATNTTTITVHALPTPAPGVYAPVCINVASITLAGTPAGGTFSGPGVTGNTFNPATAGAGTHLITYTFTNANGCTAANGTSIVVNPMPVVTAGTYAPICAEKAPIALTGTPAGGTWSGPGVTGTTFNPGTAAVGNNVVTYSYTSNAGCASTTTATIRVNPTPTSTFTLDNSICLDETTTLDATGTVSTGTINNYSWTFGSTLLPANYTNSNPFTVTYPAHGNFNITLTTTSDQGCTSTTTSTPIGVHPLPLVNFGLPAGICLPEGVAVFTNSSSVPDNSTLSYLWNFDDPGSGANNSSTIAAPSHTYNTADDYDVTLTVTSAFGCDATATQILDDFYDKPVANFSVNPAELCQGQRNTFQSTSTDPAGLNITGYKWTFGDNTAPSSAVSPTHTYTRPGNFVINLQVTNEIGCQSLPFPQNVRVHLQPIIDAGKSFTVPAGTQIEFNAISNSQDFTFSWDPPTGLSDPTKLKPTLIAEQDETYTLTAVGDFGCTATDFITVKVLKPVKVPNVFTPNGDGIHDTWLIPNLADYPACTVEVFNRYGQQVFYIAGYNKPWDGTYKGKDLPVGTYYYVIRLSNGYAPMSGSITIVR